MVVSNSSEVVLSAVDKMSIAFDLPDTDSVIAPELRLQEVRAMLVQRIIGLLNTNPEKLMAILYRIDVSEAAVNEVFGTAFPPDVPELLADLIIERQLAKAETRRHHSSS